MSFEIFVAICLVVCWASLPVSFIIASKSFEDDIIGGGHHGDDH